MGNFEQKEQWLIKKQNIDCSLLAKKYNLDPVVAYIILTRGIKAGEIGDYLDSAMERLYSPWLLKDMDRAVNILKIKIAQNNKICVVSDYDVDGVCSGYILVSGLKELGADVDLIIPDRINDGYGINKNIIDRAKENGADTILTCDNGIAAAEEIEYARTLGLTVIVTDHHEVPYRETAGEKNYILPKADAVVDQKQNDCDYPNKEICGAGIAYQLIRALYEDEKRSSEKYIVYAGLATVCDIVALTGENRVIVKESLKRVKNTSDPGLNALIDACGLRDKDINSYSYGYILGPCLNAAGRLEGAGIAANLFLEEDRQRAEILAERLVRLNNERKEMTEENKKRALEIAGESDDRILIIHLPDCHEGIAGIVAGKVKEDTGKPTMVIVDTEEGLSKGSARSIEGYNIFDELNRYRDMFEKFGGHSMAAGFSLKTEKIPELAKLLNDSCKLTDDDLALKVHIDYRLPFSRISTRLVKDLELMEPFGKGNEKPVFAESGLKIKAIRIVGKQKNVFQMVLEDREGSNINAVMFNRTKEFALAVREKYGQLEMQKAINKEPNGIVFSAVFDIQMDTFSAHPSRPKLILRRFLI